MNSTIVWAAKLVPIPFSCSNDMWQHLVLDVSCCFSWPSFLCSVPSLFLSYGISSCGITLPLDYFWARTGLTAPTMEKKLLNWFSLFPLSILLNLSYFIYLIKLGENTSSLNAFSLYPVFSSLSYPNHSKF